MAGTGQLRFDRVGSHNDPFALQDLMRRFNNVVRHGTIEKIDHTKARARIRIGPLETHWIPWHDKHAGEDITWSPYSAGEQVVVFSPSGNFNQASFMGGLFTNKGKFPMPQGQTKDTRYHKIKDGTVIAHDTQKKTRTLTMPDDGTHTVTVQKQNNVINKDGVQMVNDKAKVHVQADGTVTSTNNNGATSTLTASGDVLHQSGGGAIAHLFGGVVALNSG